MLRRRFALSAMAMLGAGLPLGSAQAQSPTSASASNVSPRLFLGDMHSHATMFRKEIRPNLRQEMEEAGVSLVGWALVDDTPFTRRTPQGIEQSRQPEPGQLWTFFQERVARYDATLRRWGLPKALTGDDVDAAVRGEPHVVMACESANFLEGQPERVAQAYSMGVRHLQLVHFIESPLGDLQTMAPHHDGGMTEAARQTIAECKRLGMLVDLAHCAPGFTDAALAASDAAMIWSHSWVRASAGTWRDWPNVARALSVEQARRIVAHGGVVGLWTVRVKSDRAYRVRDAQTYADEIMRMVDLLGPQGVAFGTDFEGAGDEAVMMRYSELRTVADSLVRRGVPEAVLKDVCIGNYARVLRKAMTG